MNKEQSSRKTNAATGTAKRPAAKPQGLKIFILHGWAYDTAKWSWFVDLLKDVGFEPTLLKVPGLTAKLKEPWTIDDYIDWLGDKLPEEPVIMLGHSNGGRIAMNFILKHPERVKKLILIASGGVWQGGGLLTVKRAVFRTIAKVGKKFTNSEKLKALLYKLARAHDYHEAEPHMKQTFQNLQNSDKLLDFSAIKTPTLIIWGAMDMVTPLKDAVIIHKAIKGSKLEIVDNARHSPMFTHAETVVKIIKSNL